MSSKIMKSGFIFVIGNLFIKSLAFITIPIFTRVLSKEVMGNYNLYLSWISIVSIFIGFQLSNSLSIAKIKYSNYDEYALNIFVFSNIIFSTIFIVFFLFRKNLVNLVGFSETYLIMIFLQSFFSYLVGFISNYFTQIQKVLKGFVFTFFVAIFQTIFSLILVYALENDLNALVISRMIPSLIASIIIIAYFFNKKNISYKIEYWVFGLTISIPLIFHNIGNTILAHFDKIMINKMLGVDKVAIYSFGYNVGIAIQIVFYSLNSIWVPYFFNLKKEGVANIRYYTSRYLSIATFLTLGYLSIYPELTRILGGQKYLESISFIPYIVLSYYFVFLYSIPSNIQFYYKNTIFIPIGTIIAGLINILLNYLLISILDIYGAVISTTISYFCLFLLHHTISRKLYKYNDIMMFDYIKNISIVIIVLFIMKYFYYSIIIRYIIEIIIIIIYFLKYKIEILNLIRKRKEYNK